MLPIGMIILGGLMTLLVMYLCYSFWATPEKGMDFASHRAESLIAVMANRYFVYFMVMGGALYYGRPEVVAFVFIVTGLSPLHDAWIYYRAGKPFIPHLIPAVLSAIVAIWALALTTQTGVA